ncbi:MAG: V-type ATP synthase subunit E family protein [candidate division WOR-3 bacterium]|nr:V-type ATP synthase subunit E family protein [candidate division WOR-3 bacterium]
MIDLTKLKEKILKEAEEEKKKILSKAEEEIKRLEENTEKEIKRLKKETEQFLEKYLEELKKREISKLKKEESVRLLNTKWKIIDKFFLLLIEEIKKDFRYLEFLKEKIKNEKFQEVIVSKNDFSLLEDFLNSLNVKIIKNDEIKNGIIIKKEKEEINLTLESVLKEIKKRYLKEINQLLFS